MEKIILDACCGGKQFWYDRHIPFVEYQDVRDADIEIACEDIPVSILPAGKTDMSIGAYINRAKEKMKAHGDKRVI